MNKTLLIIGRFQPLHLGHLAVIKRYYKAGYTIKIGLGSSQKNFEKHNPLTLEERIEKINLAFKELKIKKYYLYSIPDISDDIDYVGHVIKLVGKFDTILTGNHNVLKLFVDYKNKKPWNIESFHEPSGRPGGAITSGMIRKRWLKKKSKHGLAKSTYSYLNSINFSQRLKELEKRKS